MSEQKPFITTDSYGSDFSATAPGENLLVHTEEGSNLVPSETMLDNNGVPLSEHRDGIIVRLDGSTVTKLGKELMTLTAPDLTEEDRNGLLRRDLSLLPKKQQGFFGAHLRRDKVNGRLYRDANGSVAKLEDHELPKFSGE